MILFTELKNVFIQYKRLCFKIPMITMPILNVLILSLFSIITISCATVSPSVKNQNQVLSKRNMGEANLRQGNYTVALKYLLEAEQMDPKDPITHNYLGIAYKNKKMIDLSISHFQKAVDLNPGYSQARNNLGTAYLDNRQWDKAIESFEDVLSDVLYTTPQYPLANLGIAYFNKKEYSLAEGYFQKAIQIQPNFILALNGLGQTYMTKGQHAKAAQEFEKAARYAHRDPFLHFQLAKAYELSGKYEDAVRAYGKVIDLAPESDMATSAKQKVKQMRPN